MILDVGCGKGKVPDAIGVDIARLKGVDIIADVQYLPFKDSCVDKIICRQLLEHVDNLILAIEEMYRVLKVGGKLVIEVPHVKGLDAFRDPTHKHFFTIATMDYFTKESGYNYYSKAKFRIEVKRILLKNKLCKWLEKIINLRPQFAEHFLGGNLKPHIYWELKKEV